MSLQNLCLTAIAKDFDRFYTFFCTSQDADIKGVAEFLQRVYSYELAEQVFKDSEMGDKYTDFLINKHLEILNTDWFKKSEWKTVVEKIADIGSNVKKIHFHKHNKERPWEELCCYLPNVEVVIFHRRCAKKLLVQIVKFCLNVREVHIEWLEKEEIGVWIMKNLPSLKIFGYYPLDSVLYTMHKNDLSNLGRIQPYKLTKLCLEGFYVPCYGNLLKICSSVCPFVTNLRCLIYRPKHLDFLQDFCHLEVLQLCYEPTKFCNFLDLNNFLKSRKSKLTSLTIDKCSLSVLTLAESCPNLTLLIMSASNFEHDGNSIPLFYNLKHFRVENLNNKALNKKSYNAEPLCLVVSSSPKLESVTFHKCNLSLELKAGILKCFEQCSLKKVDFTYSSTDKAFVMDILLTCRSLETLTLERCGIRGFDKNEILKCAEILPNNPKVEIIHKFRKVSWDADGRWSYEGLLPDFSDDDDEDLGPKFDEVSSDSDDAMSISSFDD